MLRDLAGQSPQIVDADVHIIGAGIAGLLMASRLAKAGIKVVVTESGGDHQVGETHPLNAVIHRRAIYQGAEHGRFRCLGGTSTRWGGAMLPFLPSDMGASATRPWPLEYRDLQPYQAQVEAMFSLPQGDYDEPGFAARTDGAPASFTARLAKWPPFALRNVARLLQAEIARPDGPEIWLNATATDFALAPDGRLASTTAGAPDGARLMVRATDTVITAGAIESTRLLLMLDRAYQGRLFAPHDVLGRGFHDHLSVRIGTVVTTDRSALNRKLGFRFEKGGMRNLRLETSEHPAARTALPAAFTHLVPAGREGGGFDLLRKLYQHLQKRTRPPPGLVLGLAAATPWLVRAGWWFAWERRLLYPADADLELHMVIEQIPVHDNRITLSPDRVDALGSPLAVIDWAVGDADRHNLMAATAALLAFWRDSTLAGLGEIVPRAIDEALLDLEQGGGIYHPGGSTRMGDDPGNGVLDRDLRTFAVPNLSVVATSAFPSGGGANPTMTLMMAALRAADAIALRLRMAPPEVVSAST